MCGIIMKINKTKEPANREVLEQFEDQRARGTQGFGSIFLNDKGEINIKRATSEILATMDLYHTPSQMILFHHRAPSSSRNKISQTHPIKIKDPSLKHDYYFMHNGIVSNDDERKKEHDKMGWEYTTEVPDNTYSTKETMYNDSEALGIDIARFIEGETKEIESVGSAAFFMVQVDKADNKVKRIFFGRNDGNPLKMAKTKKDFMLSSEGKGDEVKPDTLYSFDPLSSDMKLKKQDFKVKRTVYSSSSSFPAAKNETIVTGFQDTYNRGRNYSYHDDDDTYDSPPPVSPEDQEAETICDWREENANGYINDFFEALRKQSQEGLYADINIEPILKDVARELAEAKAEVQQLWSENLVKEMDDQVKDKIEFPERLSIK